MFGCIRLDSSFSSAFMGGLMRCADVMVSPSSSEGFNLPVLESMAVGTPVIVPRGGSTDDFTRPSFARYITARMREVPGPGGRVLLRSLEVNETSLAEEMRFVISDHYADSAWVATAQKASVAFAREHFTWASIANTLFKHIIESSVE